MKTDLRHWTEEDAHESHTGGPRKDHKAVSNKARRQRERKQIQEELDIME